MIHDLTGLIHTVAALLAMATGSMIFMRPKGGSKHRKLGYAYSVCMVVMLGSSFMLYRLTGGFNALHLAAIMGSVTLVFGLKFAILRQPARGWYFFHYLWMSWSFVGLLAAFGAELSTRLVLPYLIAHYEDFDRTAFWTMVGVVSALVLFIGSRLIKKYQPAYPFASSDE